MNLNLYLSTKDIDVMRIYGLDYTFEGFLFPTSFAFNNSVVIEAQMPTQAELGRESVYFDSNNRMDKPYIYTDENGQLGAVSLSYYTQFPDSSTWSLLMSHMMPTASELSIIFDSGDLFYNDANLEVLKDSRERIGFSLQLHHIDTTGMVYINAGFAALNGLAGGAGLNSSSIKLAYLNIKPYSKRFLNSGDIIQSTAHSFYGTTSIRTDIITNMGDDAAAWAIIDSSNNEVLFWVDEEVASGAANTRLYINFSNTY